MDVKPYVMDVLRIQEDVMDQLVKSWEENWKKEWVENKYCVEGQTVDFQGQDMGIIHVYGDEDVLDMDYSLYGEKGFLTVQTLIYGEGNVEMSGTYTHYASGREVFEVDEDWLRSVLDERYKKIVKDAEPLLEG